MDALNKLFLVHRGDGFGARLSEMIDAIWLAEKMHGRFVFHWRDVGMSGQENAISEAKNVFDAGFLKNHYITFEELLSLNVKSIESVRSNLSAAFAPDSGIDGFTLEFWPLHRLAPELEQFVDARSDRRDAFKSIAFTPELERARRLAQDVPLTPGPIALHLRAGDIVYGRFRASGVHHNKVIPYPVSLEILRNARESGKNVVIFGQDHEMSGYMRDEYGALIANDITSGLGFGDVESALFDITLMSRCSQIIAGHSAFSVAAAKIAGIDVSTPQTILPPGYTKAAILRRLREKSDVPASELQKAMAAWHGVMATDYNLADPVCREFIMEAITRDPHNPYYQVVEAIAQYFENKTESGERTLLMALAGPQTCTDLVSHMIEWSRHAPALSAQKTRSLLDQLSSDGWPAASLMLFMMARHSKSEDLQKKYWCTYVSNKSPDMPNNLNYLMPTEALN